MPRNCGNNLYNFCYVYGQMTFALQKRNITAVVKKAYHHYFATLEIRTKVGLHTIVVTHVQLKWLNKKRKSMPLQSQWLCENQQITIATVNFVWFPQFQKEFQERRNGQWSIQIFHQLCALYFMEKNCEFLSHQNPTLWTLMIIMMMTRISLFRDHQKDLVQFFLMEGDLVYINDIDGLMATLVIQMMETVYWFI